MRYMKHFAGFALVVGMALTSATLASAAPHDDWRYRDSRMEERINAERFRAERLRAERLRAERLREARLRAEIARERLRHHDEHRYDYDDHRR